MRFFYEFVLNCSFAIHCHHRYTHKHIHCSKWNCFSHEFLNWPWLLPTDLRICIVYSTLFAPFFLYIYFWMRLVITDKNNFSLWVGILSRMFCFSSVLNHLADVNKVGAFESQPDEKVCDPSVRCILSG